MNIICPQCRAGNEAGSQFCSKCGAKLEGSPETTLSFSVPVETGEEQLIDFDNLAETGPVLIVVKGVGVGETFSVAGQETVIGRDPDSDIFLDDITVSRKHACIRRAKGKFLVADIGSLNGTYLNRRRVDEAYMANKDELQIGKFRMIFLDKTGEPSDDAQA